MYKTSEAVKVLKSGGIIIFPTETVFGVGGIIDNEKTIQRLYKIKKRLPSQPTSAVFPSLELIKDFVEVTRETEILAKAFWSGPLTIILKAKKTLPKEVLGKGGTLAVRIPSHPWLLATLQALGQPLAAPSANFKGDPAPRTYSEIDKELVNLVDYVVEVPSLGKKPSTIVDLVERPFKIVREGDITERQLQGALKLGGF